MSKNFRHFKLTNGEEIVCEILDAVDPETSVTDVIARKCMKIISFDDFENNARIYTLKPWMSFMDDTQELVALNSVHIVGEAKPSETMMIHYASGLADADKYNKVKQAGLSLKEIEDKLKELTEEEMDAFLQTKFDEIAKDSDISNIIKFRPKGTVH